MRQTMKKTAQLLCSLSLIMASQVSLAAEAKNFWGIQFEEFEYYN